MVWVIIVPAPARSSQQYCEETKQICQESKQPDEEPQLNYDELEEDKNIDYHHDYPRPQCESEDNAEHDSDNEIVPPSELASVYDYVAPPPIEVFQEIEAIEAAQGNSGGNKMKVPAAPLMIAEDLFEDKEKCNRDTAYFKSFSKCPRYPDLKTAVKDLVDLFNKIGDTSIAKDIFNYYKLYKDNDAKCVTIIWTLNIDITKLINSALIVDSVHTYKLDKKMFQYYYDALNKKKVKFRTVIRKSIKFMRLLNSCIVDLGTTYNTETRKTYRGIHKSVMPNVKLFRTFRIINWVCSSELYSIATEFKNIDGVIIEFSIPPNCFNAGQINKFGESVFFTEHETLIPPYTAVRMTRRNSDDIAVDVTRDNKDVNFDNMKVTFS